MKNSFHRIVHWLQINIASSLGIRLQCVTKVHTLTPRENRERPEFRIFLENSEKNTIFNEHPVPKSPKRIKDNAVKTLTIALNKNARKEKQVDP